MEALVSPAKINLGLSIVGQRPDQYHLLESIFWPLDYCDGMTVCDSHSLEITVRWEAGVNKKNTPLSTNENILFKCLEQLGVSPLNIVLTKNIPMGGGLGGGSSNAGTLLRYLQDRRKIPATQALETAIQLGADVPFFLNPVPSWVCGIGEQCKPLSLSKEITDSLLFLLILLPEGTNTAQIFGTYRSSNIPYSSHRSLPNHVLTLAELKDWLRDAPNDLEIPAITTLPLIGRTLDFLSSLNPMHSGMSGSGSTCYAIFDSVDLIHCSTKVIEDFCRKHGCKSVMARTFNQRQH